MGIYRQLQIKSHIHNVEVDFSNGFGIYCLDQACDEYDFLSATDDRYP